MKTIHAFPRPIREIENCWIPMSDGCRLAARVWMPADAEAAPVPAIVEYLPYRKRDRTRGRDGPIHRYFAGHGYAAVRIDLRGSGESDGLLLDEYLEREQLDGVEAIAWIARQPWCTGAVGMMGKSWGGFNALQVAALRPPELKAVLSVCSTDDRYADDAHYMGGCLLDENLIWGSVLLTLNALPPDPALVGERWREMWLERLRASPLFPEIWLAHQRRDEYWKQGSVCEDFARIACPVYAVGGWADGYSNAVPRLVAGLSVPRKGLVGPWAHVYPHQGVPGPAIGFLQEALRWWDRWLRGASAGIDDEPPYRVWMQASVPPRTFHAERPGRWVAEDEWPSRRMLTRSLALRAGELVDAAGARLGVRGDGERLELRSPQTVGVDAGAWCGFGLDGEAPGDQRADDRGSLVFDSEPLARGFEILGAPALTLAFAADRPLAFVAARLNELFPDGSSARVSYGLLNLTHRHGHERPEPLVPGERYQVRVRLNDVAHAFPAGQRLRLALSSAYWPMVWPSPEPVTLTVFPAACRLDLPVRPPRAGDERLRPFAAPEAGPAAAITLLERAPPRRTVERDPRTGETVCTVVLDADEAGRPVLERVEAIDLVQGHSLVQRFRIHPEDPLSARAEVVQHTLAQRDGWSARIETAVRLSSTRDAFRLEATLGAWEGGREVCSRRWSRDLPRDHL